MKPMMPTGPLAAIIGSTPMPRTEVTSQIWKYIKKNNLQDKANRRMINADEKLRPLVRQSTGLDVRADQVRQQAPEVEM